MPTPNPEGCAPGNGLAEAGNPEPDVFAVGRRLRGRRARQRRRVARQRRIVSRYCGGRTSLRLLQRQLLLRQLLLELLLVLHQRLVLIRQLLQLHLHRQQRLLQSLDLLLLGLFALRLSGAGHRGRTESAGNERGDEPGSSC